MTKPNEQSAILHDAYFNKSPGLIRLFLVRLVLLCALSATASWAIHDLYLTEIDPIAMCGISAAAAGILCLLASFFPSGIVYMLSIAGMGALFFNETVREKLSFFWDYLVLTVDGRLLKLTDYTIHNLDKLNNGFYEQELMEAEQLGFTLIGIMMAMLFVMTSRTRFRPFYTMLIFAIFAAPVFAAEIAGFHTSIVFFAACYFAFYAVRMAYELDGMFVFDKSRAAADAMRRNEKSYRRRMFFSAFDYKFRNDVPRYIKYNANSIIALIVTCAVMLTTAQLVPEGETFDYEEFFADVKDTGFSIAEKLENSFGVEFGSGRAANEYFSYSQYGDNSGGIGISEPSDSDRPVLDVILERNDIPVYLRGDIGVNFTGTTWTALRDEYEKITYNGKKKWGSIKDFYSESQYQITRQKMTTFGYDPDKFLPLQKVSVTYRRKSGVVFQPLAPFDLDYRDSEYFDSYGDTIYRVKGGNGYLNTYESLALTPNMNYSGLSGFLNDAALSGYGGSWTVPGELSNEQYKSFVTDYEEFVKGAYTAENTPEIDGLMTALYDGGYIGTNLYDTASGVCRYFKENFTYSLTVDNGAGDEVLSNFLYNTKQGHCALFATSAVLALRRLGHEARYVTGYVVSGQGNYTSEGYLYTLREKDLHAWIEVYFEGIGWLPFDPTAAVAGFVQENETTRPTQTFTDIAPTGSDGFLPDDNATAPPDAGEEFVDDGSEEESEQTVLPPDITEGSELITPADPQNPAEPKEENKLIPVLITVLCVIAAVGALIAAVYMLVKRVNNAEKRAINGFKKKSPNRAVAEMYQLCMIILSKEGLTPGCEMMTDFAERVDASIFLKGSNVFMVDIMPVFVKCEFGDAEISPVTEEERAAVYKFTTVVYRKFMEDKGALKRFITKFSLFL